MTNISNFPIFYKNKWIIFLCCILFILLITIILYFKKPNIFESLVGMIVPLRQNLEFKTNELYSRIIPFRFYENFPKYKRVIIYKDKTSLENMDPKNYNIVINKDPHFIDGKNCDIIISTRKNDLNIYPSKTIYLPRWSIMIPELSEINLMDLIKTRTLYEKTKFCACMYSNCDEKLLGVKTRQIFTTKLSKRKQVDYIGQCSDTIYFSDKDSDWFQNILEIYKPYKFVIVIENDFENGYISEKILIPLLVGCIPIYMGFPKNLKNDEDIKNHFNPKCFISIRDFRTEEECINHILNVDRNLKLFQEYTKTPIITLENLKKYVPWYFGEKNFYDKINLNIPMIHYKLYEPLTLWKSNPDKIVKVINLIKSKQRWSNIVKQFKFNTIQIQYERFPAIDGNHISKTFIEENVEMKGVSVLRNDVLTKFGRQSILRFGELGVYLSHMEICYNLIKDPDNDYYVIFEDDVKFKNLKSINSYTQIAPKNWDIIFLGINKNLCFPDKLREFSRLDMDCIPGSFSYIIRKKAAQFLINFGLPIQIPIDEFYRFNSNNLNIYFYTQNDVGTDYLNTTTIHDSKYIL